MSGTTPIRDPNPDHLITPQNAAITFIDYQPEQYAGVGSIDTKTLLAGVITLGEIATAYGLPVVLSTVGVQSRGMQGTNTELKAALPGVPEIDRTTLNSWEDPDFRAAYGADFLVGGLGKLAPKKNWMLMVRAAEILARESFPVQWLLAGDGSAPERQGRKVFAEL